MLRGLLLLPIKRLGNRLLVAFCHDDYDDLPFERSDPLYSIINYYKRKDIKNLIKKTMMVSNHKTNKQQRPIIQQENTAYATMLTDDSYLAGV